jgi:hypothetical protein
MNGLYSQPSPIGAGMLGREEKESPQDALVRLITGGKKDRFFTTGKEDKGGTLAIGPTDPGQPLNISSSSPGTMGQGIQDAANNYNRFSQQGQQGGGSNVPMQGDFMGGQQGQGWQGNTFTPATTATGPGMLAASPHSSPQAAWGAGDFGAFSLPAAAGGSTGLGAGATTTSMYGLPAAGGSSLAGTTGGAGAGAGSAAGIGALGAAAWLAAPIALVMGLRMKRSADRKEEAKREEAWASTLTPEAREKHYSPEERARRAAADVAHRKKIADETALAELLSQGE